MRPCSRSVPEEGALRRGIPATPALKRPSAHSMNCGFSIVIVRPSLRIRHGEVRAAAIMRSPLCQQVFTHRSEEHTSELQSLMRISYAVFCLKKTKKTEIKQRLVVNTKST